MNNIILNLTIEETDLILNTVAQLPYNQCFQLIAKLQNQANEQVNKKDKRKYDDIANEKLSKTIKEDTRA